LALLNIDSLNEYYNFLSSNEDELLELINHIIVNETTFFRHDEQYKTLAGLIRKLPEKNISINILSAGCSTGEEPYSIAMYLKNSLPQNFFDKIKITAIDISSFNIKIAARAVYPLVKIEKIKDKNFVRCFFSSNDSENFSINPQIKSKVDFSVENLFTVTFKQKFNFIFCRNVMIYFSEEKRNFLVNKYHSLLNDEGFFFLAPTESLFETKQIFERIRENDITYYKKITDKKNSSSFTLPVKTALLQDKRLFSKEPEEKFSIKFAGLNGDYLDMEFFGFFEMDNIGKINYSLKKIIQEFLRLKRSGVILIFNEVKYIDAKVLKQIGLLIKSEARLTNKILVTTTKEQILRIFSFHEMEELYELL